MVIDGITSTDGGDEDDGTVGDDAVTEMTVLFAVFCLLFLIFCLLVCFLNNLLIMLLGNEDSKKMAIELHRLKIKSGRI